VATIAGNADGATAPAAAATATATFPADWRAQLAGDDRAALTALERFASPKAVWDSLKALQTRVSSGELRLAREAPAGGATPEEIAAWRKDNGLPETVDSYSKELKLSDGLVLADSDKPLVESFAQAAHAANVPQPAFNAMVDWYYGQQREALAQRSAADATFRDGSLATLAQEWGPELKTNQRVMANLMEMAPGGLAPDGVGTQILMARLPNGQILANDPGACRFLTQLGREMFPQSTIVPPGTPDASGFVGNRIGAIEKLMGDQRSEYWRGPTAVAMQQEYRELVDARDKMKARSA
jgi:hypothetical protein